MKNLPRIVFIHGNGGATGQTGWQPTVKRQLEHHGFEVLNPTMPDNIEAKASVWLPYLHDELGVDERTILIGHSSGAVAAMRHAEQHRIFASVLIGVCHTDLGMESERISGYFHQPWDWEKIVKHQQWIVQFASQNDPFIPIAEARFVHQKLNCEYHEYTDREHFGYPTEITAFPEVTEAILRWLKII